MSKTHAETRALVEKSLRRRYWAERRFRAYGLCAVMVGILFVFFLFGTILSKGYTAFRQAELQLEVFYDPAVIDPEGTRRPRRCMPRQTTTCWCATRCAKCSPEVQERSEIRQLAALISSSATHELQRRVEANPRLIGTREKLTVLAGADVDQLLKGAVDRKVLEEQRVLSDRQLAWIDELTRRADLHLAFNKGFPVQRGFARNRSRPASGARWLARSTRWP